MRYPKLRELKEAIKALIKGPYTSKFPYEPHNPFERFRGKPVFYEKDCMGCTACLQVCPARAIEMEDKAGKRHLTVHWDTCIFCGQCEANCPTTKGIMLSREFDLATTEARSELKQEIQKELVLCESCKDVIAPKDQILWVARRLGPLLFSNASLIPYYQNQLIELALECSLREPAKEEDFLRSDRLKMLCPRCRRQSVLKS